MHTAITILAVAFTTIFIFDRIWKVAAIQHFFHQEPAPEPDIWPSLSLIQPITASPNDLKKALSIRAQIHYPGALEQILVCDALDLPSQALCRNLMEQYPNWKPKLVVIPANEIALKTVKQLAGLEAATCDVLCFVDDDILLRADTLTWLVRHLRPGIGATFGVACYTNWSSAWSGLMSAFVNANALLNYIPVTYFMDPYTVTGHIYALKRIDFDAIGGLNGMAERLDDDHEIARRVMRAGLRNQQTRALYDVDNDLPNMRAFMHQMKRWFVFPRELMLPGIPKYQKVFTYAVSLPNLLPGLTLLLIPGGTSMWIFVAACLIVFYAIYFGLERSILKQPTPRWGWALLLVVALILPFQILFLLFTDNIILWRGQRMRVMRDGRYENIH